MQLHHETRPWCVRQLCVALLDVVALSAMQGFQRFDALKPVIRCPPEMPLQRYGGSEGV
jgi:hypothetical protein